MDFLEQHPYWLAVAIFLARVIDVSLGTVRTILVIRGHRIYAALIGFVEVLIWIVAVAQVMRNLDSWYLAVAYAAGFAVGNVVGMWLENMLALGQELVRAISENRDVDLADELRRAGFSVLEMDGHDDDRKPVEVLLIVEKRRRIPRLLAAIRTADPEALCTVTDVKQQTSRTSPEFAAALRERTREGAFRVK